MSGQSRRECDVVIVGGRIAGASLAARLGAAGLEVVVVDKAELPSRPEVPSSALVYSCVPRLLDEIGVAESDYADAVERVDEFVMEFDGSFRAVFRVPEVEGRDYAYAVDRAGFDHALWTKLEGHACVTTRAGFKVDELLRDEQGRVSGVVGHTREGEPERVEARLCVVGADGRYSFVGRRAGAKIFDDCDATSTVYQAEWEGVGVPPGFTRRPARIITRGRGQTVLVFPLPRERAWVVVHTRSDHVDLGAGAQAFYEAAIDDYPCAREALVGARQVSELFGVKRIANRYMSSGGPGWVLVGDAVHMKDPVDGQGIYDALAGARRLASILIEHHGGGLDWDGVLVAWHAALREETEVMFRETSKRLREELYGAPSRFVIKQVIRRVMQDPLYQDQFLRHLCRELPADSWRPPSLMLGALARGVWRDLRGETG